MEDQSVDWAEYARIQEELKKSKTSNDRQWGLEYAHNAILGDIVKGNSFDRSDVERRIRSGARRNRYRTRLLRLQPIAWQPENTDPSVAFESRSALKMLQAEVDDFDLIEKVAKGYNYDELATHGNDAVGALRKRVSRIRKRARTLLPDG
ncbi:hypothetical protein [Pseudovibrio sp. POLY-S9]|uniref:hypothetical protein n=1 Tax=Pseudovibrio sp. POLY-S9 TaxID=1576596 RepID=UPI00070D164C|nr:hypothetical protein [Pseudovibrio sp. POLY-S9]